MWKNWFSKYKVPVKVVGLVRSGMLVDRTQARDVTPHFEAEAGVGTVVLWVDHPDPSQRYLPDGFRYTVDVHQPGRLPETLVESDRLEDALEVVLRIVEEGKGLRLL